MVQYLSVICPNGLEGFPPHHSPILETKFLPRFERKMQRHHHFDRLNFGRPGRTVVGGILLPVMDKLHENQITATARKVQVVLSSMALKTTRQSRLVFFKANDNTNAIFSFGVLEAKCNTVRYTRTFICIFE